MSKSYSCTGHTGCVCIYVFHTSNGPNKSHYVRHTQHTWGIYIYVCTYVQPIHTYVNYACGNLNSRPIVEGLQCRILPINVKSDVPAHIGADTMKPEVPPLDTYISVHPFS